MAQIYTAFYNILASASSVTPDYVNHLYLVKDSDGDLGTTTDQEILRGGPQNPGISLEQV